MTDWEEVQRLMLLSFSGTRLSESEMEMLKRAHASDREEYVRRHTRVKDDEIARLRMQTPKAH